MYFFPARIVRIACSVHCMARDIEKESLVLVGFHTEMEEPNLGIYSNLESYTRWGGRCEHRRLKDEKKSTQSEPPKKGYIGSHPHIAAC